MLFDNFHFVSRGGLKLQHALLEFQLDARGLRCADFGCNVGGFTDCLLQAGAAHVTAVDTGYGTLAWKLRQDPRVTTLERTNALHAAPPVTPVDLVVVDMAWTPQRLCVPAAIKWLAPGGGGREGGRIVTLIKPHYELAPDEKHLLTRGVLNPDDAHRITTRTLETMPTLGVSVAGCVKSPIEGGAGKKSKSGNSEWLALLVVSKTS